MIVPSLNLSDRSTNKEVSLGSENVQPNRGMVPNFPSESGGDHGNHESDFLSTNDSSSGIIGGKFPLLYFRSVYNKTVLIVFGCLKLLVLHVIGSYPPSRACLKQHPNLCCICSSVSLRVCALNPFRHRSKWSKLWFELRYEYPTTLGSTIFQWNTATTPSAVVSFFHAAA